MNVPLDLRQTVHVARQPILDRHGRVFGYELLYRANAGDTQCTASGDLAASRVITDALTTFDLETLTGGRPAFVNLTRQLLVVDAAMLLPPNTTVLEIREDVEIDAEVIDTCRRLHSIGYALALDDFVEGSDAGALLPYVKYVKIDVQATSPASRDRLAAGLPKHVHLIAERVETPEMVESARKAGYHLFQGYYFCKPVTRSAKALPARRMAYLNLFAELNRPNLSIMDLQRIVEHDLSLSYRVLRSVNSAAYTFNQQISSIRHALVLLGINQVKKWAMVWSLAGVNSGGTPETVSMSLLRARCCELVASSLDGADRGGEIFLLGLCSLLDAILEQPMAEVLRTLPLPTNIQQALLGKSNRERTILDAVVGYEQADWDAAAGHAQTLGLPETMLPSAYSDALRWTRELSRDAIAA